MATTPLAKRIVDALKPTIRGALSQGSWYKLDPESWRTTSWTYLAMSGQIARSKMSLCGAR